MVPSAFVVLERSSADAERQARPQCAAGTGVTLTPVFGVARATPQEEILCALFAEVLGVEAGRHRRQLLRAGRRQHHVDPAGEPGAQGWAGDHAASGVRASDRRGLGCRCQSGCGDSRLRRDRHRHWRTAGDADHALACWSVAGRSTVPPGDAAAGAGRAAGGSSVGALQACSIITMHCGCVQRLEMARSGAWRLRRRCGAGAKTCLRSVDICGLDEEARCACIMPSRPGGRARLSPASGVMVQAVWFDAGSNAAGRLLLTSIIWRSTGCRGASWCRILAAAWEAIARGRGACAGAARHLVAALGAAACGAGAGGGLR